PMTSGRRCNRPAGSRVHYEPRQPFISSGCDSVWQGMEREKLESALEALHPASFGWALSCCHRDREEAEEVLQMSYLKIIEGKARFDDRSSFKTWLFAVIRHTALERYRWRRVRRILFVEAASPPRPDQILERSERTQRLLRALLKISTRQRDVL